MSITHARAGLLVVAVLAAGCASDDPAAEPAATSVPTEAPTTDVPDTAPLETQPSATEPVSTEAPTTEPSTTEVPVTEAPTTEAPTAPTYDFAAVGPIVEDFVAERGLNGAGLIIVDDADGVIHDDYWGEFDADRISLVASSSKMVTAGVLLRLQDDGVLDIDAPVADVAPWGAANPTVTTAQLLSNSAGLPGLGDGLAIPPYLCQYGAAGTMQQCVETIFTTTDDDDSVVPPDTEFDYGGAQWQVAGAVAELASGQSWAQLIDEIYVQPCALETLAFNNHFSQIGTGGFDYPAEFNGDPGTLQPTENPNMEGGMYVTTGDYAKLLLMHLRGGMCGDEMVLSQDSLDLMHADRIAEVYGADAYSPDTGYGMGWWIDRPSGRISDGGAYGSVPWLDLEDGYGAYLVIEADSSTGGELADLLFDVVDQAHAAAS